MDTLTVPILLQEIYYPERDGKPIAESDVHRRELSALIEVLEHYFVDAADVYISGNLMFYYEEGNPAAVTSPDVFVVKDVPKKLRRTYKLWEEQQPPVTVFEITSRSTRLEDKGNKRELFAELGVREYFLFDPLSEYLKPPFQGFRLAGEKYVPIEPEVGGALVSEELGLRIVRDDSYLRLSDRATGERLLRASELYAVLRAGEQQANAEAAARRAVEEEIKRLRAELARLRGE